MTPNVVQEREERFNGKPHLSHSKINKYLAFPEQYRLYYLERLRPKVPSATLVFGQVIHHALADMFKGAKDPVAIFQAMWQTIKEVPLKFSQRDSWEKLKNAGEALLGKLLTQELKRIRNVSAVEQPFELDLTNLDLPLVGIIDLQADLDEQPAIVDFKTAGSGYDGYEAALADQLTAYKLARLSIERFALCVLVKTKEPQIEWHLTSRTPEQVGRYLKKIGHIGQDIAANRFFTRPGTWCAWCDYLPVCLGDKRRTAETLVTVG